MKFSTASVLVLALAACSKQAPDGDKGNSNTNDDTTMAATPIDAASALSPNAEGRKSFASFSVSVPSTWQAQPLSSKMRVAHWTMPEAELIVYHFGAGPGTVEQNLQRWYGQFEQADGSPSADAAKVESAEISGLKVTSVDLSGRYVAALRPGAPEKHNKPGHRMLAAVVEAPDGSYFFKLLGPQAAVEAQKANFKALLASIQK